MRNLAQETGLNCSEKRGVIYGEYNGCRVTVHMNQQQRRVFVQFWTKESGQYPTGEKLADFLAAYPQQNTQVQSAQTQGNAAILVLKLSSAKKTGAAVKAAVTDTADFLRRNGYVSCCEQCGTEEGLSTYVVNGGVTVRCSACYQQLQEGLHAAKQEIKARRGNMFTGVIGSFVGALIGVIVWVIIYQMGYVAGLAGLVLAVCALKGYELLGGKLNAGGLAISCVIAVVMAFVAHNVGFGLIIYQEIGKEIGATVFESIRLIPDFLSLSGEISGAYVQDLVIGYLLMIVAAVPTIIGMYRSKNLLMTMEQLPDVA